ncbi:hypothetical protein AB0D57_19420 [Streptomyces sp. NPDC048275]|uniref:hypothetical protein n=1 Tax=Streptomyces sp. NPDC048275 TaxID=3155629 RepID=UPI0033EFC6DE
MTEAPSGSPWGAQYDGRRIHAAREPSPAPEGPLQLVTASRIRGRDRAPHVPRAL